MILADEMGLGKTIQTIGFLKELFIRYKITRPFLVTVPLSTIENWSRELKTWFPEARVVQYLGNKESRYICRTADFFLDLKDINIPKFNVLLCSYESLRNDFSFFAKLEWACLVIDEGQKIKNNNSKFFKMCNALKSNFRVLLSGTPLQNNFEELFNLMEFLDS